MPDNDCKNVTFTNNGAAGSEFYGIEIKFNKCDKSTGHTINKNYAHGTGLGVADTSTNRDCTDFGNFAS